MEQTHAARPDAESARALNDTGHAAVQGRTSGGAVRIYDAAAQQQARQRLVQPGPDPAAAASGAAVAQRVERTAGVYDEAAQKQARQAMVQRLAEVSGPARMAGGGAVVQRHISYEPIAARFEVDRTRPAWTGTVGAMAPGLLQSRNHIVPFEAMQNDLANVLNTYLATGVAQPLIDLTDSLFPTQPAPEYANMVARRTALVNAVNGGLVGQYNARSRAVLSSLNSSPDNVRLGGATNNLRIGENLDADFNAGSIQFTGQVDSAAGVQNVVNLDVATLTAASNDVLYGYQRESGQPLTFVLSLLTNRQISSGTGPTAGGHGNQLPVLVTDPAGINDPFLYE